MTQRFNELPGEVKQKGSPLSKRIIKIANGQRNTIIVGDRNDSGVRLVKKGPLGLKTISGDDLEIEGKFWTLSTLKKTERPPRTSPFHRK